MFNAFEWILLFNAVTIGITTWVYPNERLPKQNKAMAVGSYNQTIFLLGGYPLRTQMTQYHTNSKTFAYIGDDVLPINTSAFGQGWTQKEEILYFVDYRFPFSIAMYRMDTQQFTTNWIDPPIEMGTAACLASSHDNLFVVGGYYNTTAHIHNKLQILNFNSLQWANNPPSMNDARSHAACIVANDYLWVFGGAGVSYSVDLATNERVELMNITQKSWMSVAPLTIGLSGLRAALHKNTIYIIGGWNDIFSKNLVYLMDTQTGAITGTDHLPFETFMSSAIVVDNVLYVFGGQLLQHDKLAYLNLLSVAPSKLPTSVPSKLPTSVPSNMPSIHPTVDPSEMPSSHPSSSPSTEPSASPIATTGVLAFNETYTTTSPSIRFSTISNAPVRPVQISNTHIVLIGLGTVFLCIILCVLIYKKHKNVHTNDENDAVDVSQIEMNNINSKQTIESIEKVMDENEEESEKDVIKIWLMDIVKLPQYYSLFVGNGYDTLRCVAAMKDKSELQEIGITLPGHQTRIIREIKRLNQTTKRNDFLKGEESLSEEDVDDHEDNDVYEEVIFGMNRLDEDALHNNEQGGNTLGEGDAPNPRPPPPPPPTDGRNTRNGVQPTEDEFITAGDDTTYGDALNPPPPPPIDGSNTMIMDVLQSTEDEITIT